MENFNKLLEELKSLILVQTSVDWAENIPLDIWEKYFKGNFKTLKSNLNVDTHRWYETSDTVIEIYGGILGINHISNIFSESMMCEDCFHTIQFCEMEVISTISYKTKKK